MLKWRNCVQSAQGRIAVKSSKASRQIHYNLMENLKMRGKKRRETERSIKDQPAERAGKENLRVLNNCDQARLKHSRAYLDLALPNFEHLYG